MGCYSSRFYCFISISMHVLSFGFVLFYVCLFVLAFLPRRFFWAFFVFTWEFFFFNSVYEYIFLFGVFPLFSLSLCLCVRGLFFIFQTVFETIYIYILIFCIISYLLIKRNFRVSKKAHTHTEIKSIGRFFLFVRFVFMFFFWLFYFFPVFGPCNRVFVINLFTFSHIHV